jgi:hypothetical protein
MTKPTALKFALVLLSTWTFSGCGTDPYVGDTLSDDASMKGDSTTSSATTTQTVTSTAGADARVNGTDAPTDNANVENIYMTVAPVRELDLVFMVDNSPSMAPKQAKMTAQFPNLINALKDTDGTLPNLRIAIIDSDLGTAGAFTDPYCGLKDNGTNAYGDRGHFQMINATKCGVQSADDLFLEYKNGLAVNYTGDINTVFQCLASGLGTMGCGEEHSLQAFEFALVVQGLGNDDQQNLFLRPSAYLGLVFLSDEDDCSAATNDSMFGDISTLMNESASLRCATRTHKCGGNNLSDTPPGYPTTAPFVANFSNCAARVDTSDTDPDRCPNAIDMLGESNTDASVPTTCNPLKSIRKLADEIKSLKSNPDEQILVAGIYGWPLSDPNDPTVFEKNYAAAQYKIDKVPNPNSDLDPSRPTLYDYWPICYDPNHKPAIATTDSTTGFDSTAAGWGATGGLRMSAFIDQFDANNGMKFSICQTDFSDAMKQIGVALAGKLQNICLQYKLLDTDVNTAGLQADCTVNYRVLVSSPSDPTITVYHEDTQSLPECNPSYSATNLPPSDCWQLSNDTTKCPYNNGQLVTVLRTAAEVAAGPLAAGTQLHLQCRICSDSDTSAGCNQ